MARSFYYDTGESKKGPVSGNDLVRLRAAGEISDDTWVRKANSSTWRRLVDVDLREEEEQEANPSLWRLFARTFGWRTLVLFIAVMVVIIALAIGVLSFAWPIILVLILVWALQRISRD